MGEGIRIEIQAGQNGLQNQWGRISFGPPGSGSEIICTDPDPSLNKQKIEKTLISTFSGFPNDLFSLNIVFVGISKTTDGKNRTRICNQEHGSKDHPDP
jgi:hypothetical protein